MASMQIQFSTSTAFMSGLITRACHGPFSHCDIIVPGEGLLGVSGEDKSIGDPGGVRIRTFHPWPYLHLPRVATLAVDDDLASRVIARAKTQLGKPFDNGALWSIISGAPGVRDWRALESWFCSELIA